MRARQTRRAAMFDRLRAMVQHQNGLLVAALVAESSSKGERRTVSRALGSWRGSTLSGYLRDGDDQTYLENFRCTKARFECLVHQLFSSETALSMWVHQRCSPLTGARCAVRRRHCRALTLPRGGSRWRVPCMPRATVGRSRCLRMSHRLGRARSGSIWSKQVSHIFTVSVYQCTVHGHW